MIHLDVHLDVLWGIGLLVLMLIAFAYLAGKAS